MPDRIIYGKFEVFEHEETQEFTVELEDEDKAPGVTPEVTTFSGPNAEQRAYDYRSFLLAGGLGCISLLCQICWRSWRPPVIDAEPLDSHCDRCEKRYGPALCEAMTGYGYYSLRLTSGEVIRFNEARAVDEWIEIPHAEAVDDRTKASPLFGGHEREDICIRASQVSWARVVARREEESD